MSPMLQVADLASPYGPRLLIRHRKPAHGQRRARKVEGQRFIERRAPDERLAVLMLRD